MTHDEGRPTEGAPHQADEAEPIVPPFLPHQLADVWSWGAVFLDDGRVTSIAALRGYRGAVEAVRCG